MQKLLPVPLSATAAAAVLAVALTVPVHAARGGADVVIDEVYPNGGSAGAVHTHKFVELYNPADEPVDLTGWSLQYRSASGAGAATERVELSGTTAPGGYFLVPGGSNGGSGDPLPTPDLASGGLDPAGVSGTILLSDGTGPLTAPTGSVTGVDGIVDLLGYGTSDSYETAAATGPSGNGGPRSTTRADGVDTDDNAADFTATTTVTPQNSGGTGSDPGPGPEPGVPPVELPIREIQGTGETSPPWRGGP